MKLIVTKLSIASFVATTSTKAALLALLALSPVSDETMNLF